MGQYIKVYENAFSPEFCQLLIDRFNADPRVVDDPQPDYSTRRCLNVSILPNWVEIGAKITEIASHLCEDYFSLPEEYIEASQADWFDDGYIISCYDVGDICALHVDGQSIEPGRNHLRLATLLFYLNDVETGGETHFPMQGVKVKPERGKAIIFPPGLTHPHEVLPAKEKRYVLQTWIVDPNLMVVPAMEYEPVDDDEMCDQDD